jgi:hypothetical protein
MKCPIPEDTKPATELSCSGIRDSLYLLHQIIDVSIDANRHVKVQASFVTKFLDVAASNTITTQMLIASGMYGSVASLASSAHAYRLNFQGETPGLYTKVLLMMISGLFGIVLWLFVHSKDIRETFRQDRDLVDDMSQTFSPDCGPDQCPEGTYFTFICHKSNGCAPCKTSCPVGQYLEAEKCGSAGHRAFDGCHYCSAKRCHGGIFVSKDCSGKSSGCQCPIGQVPSVGSHGTHCEAAPSRTGLSDDIAEFFVGNAADDDDETGSSRSVSVDDEDDDLPLAGTQAARRKSNRSRDE